MKSFTIERRFRLMPMLAAALLGAFVADLSETAVGQDTDNPMNASDEGTTERAEAFGLGGLMRRFDKDRNGRLDPEEQQRVRQFVELAREGRARVEEDRTKAAEGEPSWQDLIEAYDANQDGQIQSKERLDVWNAIRNLAGRASEPTSRDEWLKQVDANGDGEIDATERKNWEERLRRNTGSGRRAIVLGRKQLEQRQGLTRRSLLSTFDKNGDGTIDAEERKLAQENLLKGLLIVPVDNENNAEESVQPGNSSDDIKT